MNDIERLKKIEQMNQMGLSEDDAKNLRSILNGGRCEYKIAITAELIRHITGGTSVDLGCMREFGEGAIINHLKNNVSDDDRMKIVGVPLHCDGGWLVAGCEDSLIVAMVNEPVPNTVILEVKIDNGSWELVKSNFPLDLATDSNILLHTFVNSYTPGARDEVQAEFDKIITMYQRDKFKAIC